MYHSKFSVVAPNTIRRDKTFKIYVRGLDIVSTTDITIVLASDDGSYKIEKAVRFDTSTRSKTVRLDVS
jgi:hypothetical protein